MLPIFSLLNNNLYFDLIVILVLQNFTGSQLRDLYSVVV